MLHTCDGPLVTVLTTHILSTGHSCLFIWTIYKTKEKLTGPKSNTKNDFFSVLNKTLKREYIKLFLTPYRTSVKISTSVSVIETQYILLN